MPIHAEERSIRVALFSAEIDLAYHRARCSSCQSNQEDAEEELIAA